MKKTVILLTMLFSSLSLAQTQPPQNNPMSVESKTGDGNTATTIVDMNGNLKVMTPETSVPVPPPQKTVQKTTVIEQTGTDTDTGTTTTTTTGTTSTTTP